MTESTTLESEDSLAITKIEQEALERKLGLAHDYIIGIINNCVNSGSIFLDLSRKSLPAIPEELFAAAQIQYLYLEGNLLESLPEDFFKKLPNLVWLDLRYNRLRGIPSPYIGSHRNLQTLLVEGNQIQTLPLELGSVGTLDGLNMRGNPLIFPTKEITKEGVHAIKAYLRQMLLAKSNGELNGHNSNSVADVTNEADSGDDTFGARPSSHQRIRSRPQSAKSDSSEVMGRPVSLHRQQSYKEMKSDKMNKLKLAGALGNRADQRPPRPTKLKDVNLYPEPPPLDLIDMRIKQKQGLSIQQEKNEKIDVILQRRKNEEKLNKFREETKAMQRQKDMEKYMNGGHLDFAEPAREAPFDTGEEDMKMMSNEERIKQGVRENHERIRKILSPRALKQQELERAAQERELQDKIKEHTKQMRQRRKKPKGTAAEEMEAALKELEIAKRLQTELDKRKRDLDYRFRAYNPA